VWIIKAILYLLVLVAMALFFTQNSEETVGLKLLNWQFLDIPVYFVMLGGFFSGLLVSQAQTSGHVSDPGFGIRRSVMLTAV
jgi:uncharacterized integral membrane protein